MSCGIGCVFIVLTVGAISCEAWKQRLVVILLDGVRWDYVERDNMLRGFQRIAKEGIMAKYVTPIFPSVSYPNWYTIATGLYAESHGIVGNFIFDLERNDTFMMGPHPNVSHEHWWNKTESIWINAEKHGVRTAMHYWDGCQVPIHGVKPTLCESYRKYWNWKSVHSDTLAKLADVLDWFKEDDRNSFAMVYYEGPDAFGHKYGPESAETRQEIRDTSLMLETFQNLMDISGIEDQVNLIVLSDHGMTDLQQKQINILDDLGISKDIQWMMEQGTEGGLIPIPGKEQQVYDAIKNAKLPGLHVYWKEELPEKYHLSHSRLTTPIVLVSDLGHVFLRPGTQINASYTIKGVHGYDPYVKGDNPMRTVMYAKGPAFRRGIVGEPIQQTDHYNVFCFILGIPPHPNNGSWDRVKDFLIINGATIKQENNVAILLAIISVSWSSFLLN